MPCWTHQLFHPLRRPFIHPSTFHLVRFQCGSVTFHVIVLDPPFTSVGLTDPQALSVSLYGMSRIIETQSKIPLSNTFLTLSHMASEPDDDIQLSLCSILLTKFCLKFLLLKEISAARQLVVKPTQFFAQILDQQTYQTHVDLVRHSHRFSDKPSFLIREIGLIRYKYAITRRKPNPLKTIQKQIVTYRGVKSLNSDKGEKHRSNYPRIPNII